MLACRHSRSHGAATVGFRDGELAVAGAVLLVAAAVRAAAIGSIFGT